MRFKILLQARTGLLKNDRAIALLVLMGLASASSAADYAAGASIDVNTSHNDNIRLVERNKIQVQKYAAKPTFSFSVSTETTKLELSSIFDFNRYNRSEFNSNDQNIALAFSQQSESSAIGLNAALIRNSTITSELLTSGRIGDKAERTEQYQVSPSWTYTLNENNLVQVVGSYTTQDYHTSNYTGYKNAGGEFDWIHIINERLKLVGAATYSDYHSDDITLAVVPPFPVENLLIQDPESGQFFNLNIPVGGYGRQSYATRTKNKGVQIGLDYQWSEASLIQARLGRSKNDTTYPVKDPQNICSDPSYQALLGIGINLGAVCIDIPREDALLSTAELDWTWRNERQHFSLNTTKSTQPSANGYVVDALQVGSSWSYQLTELDQISSYVSVTRNRAIGNKNSRQNTSIADRDYAAATLEYRHQIGEDWFVNASYQFSEQKYTDVDFRANSKVISVGIRYQPQQWHWSR